MLSNLMRLTIVFLLMIAVAACGGDDGDKNNSNGGSNECTADSGCTDDKVCTEGKCNDGECTFTNIIGCCEADEECTGDTYCDNDKNRCVAACTDDAGCADEKVCTEDKCAAGKCTNEEIANCCENKGDCSENQDCVNNLCEDLVNCTADASICGDGYYCDADSGNCELITTCDDETNKPKGCGCTDATQCKSGLCPEVFRIGQGMCTNECDSITDCVFDDDYEYGCVKLMRDAPNVCVRTCGNKDCPEGSFCIEGMELGATFQIDICLDASNILCEDDADCVNPEEKCGMFFTGNEVARACQPPSGLIDNGAECDPDAEPESGEEPPYANMCRELVCGNHDASSKGGYCAGLCNTDEDCDYGVDGVEFECRELLISSDDGIFTNFCMPGKSCTDAVNSVSCTTNADCDPGVCDTELGHCVCNPVGGNCEQDNDCVRGGLCFQDDNSMPDGYCMVYTNCNNPETPCPEGAICTDDFVCLKACCQDDDCSGDRACVEAGADGTIACWPGRGSSTCTGDDCKTIGDTCNQDDDCIESAFCFDPESYTSFVGGYCSKECARQGDTCPDGSKCWDIGIELCLKECDTDEDCREGYVCSDMDEDGGKGCFVANEYSNNPDGAPVGAKCTETQDCITTAACIENDYFVDGYCLVFGCDAENPCPGGDQDVCIPFSNGATCLDKCTPSATTSECRKNYTCFSFGMGYNACYPGCTVNSSGASLDCEEGYHCNGVPGDLGECVVYCEADSDCGSFSKCNTETHMCEELDCNTEGGGCVDCYKCNEDSAVCMYECNVDGDCLRGNICHATENWCSPVCTAEGETCEDDYHCNTGTGHCDADCTSDSCAADSYCDDETGMCIVKCTGNDDCDEGLTCDTDTGICACVPACDGKSCGDDGCGDVCGECNAWEECSDAFECNLTVEEATSTVVINEVLAKGSVDEDWIELFNTGDTAVDISGWSLNDDDYIDADKYTFPADTTIAAGAYLVLVKDVEFTFGVGKADAILFLNAAGALVDIADWEDGDAPEDKTYGRIPNGTGDFKTLDTPTKGAENQDNQ